MGVVLYSGRPGNGMTLRNDRRCMLDIRHIVERRCGSQEVAGRWCDVWVAHGTPHEHAEFARQEADSLRAGGFTVRVRPVVF